MVVKVQAVRNTKVTIWDREPHVKGWILDVSPSTAKKIEIMKHKGAAKVKVDPIAFPKSNSSETPSVAAKKTKGNKPTSAVQRK